MTQCAPRREKEKKEKSGTAGVRAVHMYSTNRNTCPWAPPWFGSPRDRQINRQRGRARACVDVCRARECVRVCVCVISADKNITQASPRRSFDDGDSSGDGKLAEIFGCSNNFAISPVIGPSPSTPRCFSRHGREIIPCDLPQPQRN